MVPRVVLLPLLAAVAFLAARPAAADMILELANQSRVQVIFGVAGASSTRIVIPGETFSQGPYTETKTIELAVAGIEAMASGKNVLCRGTAVFTALPGTSVSNCEWVAGAGDADQPAKCAVATSGNSTQQCRVMFHVSPTQ
ncbi:MAG: hypothetical protein AB7P02_02300 [Alphaproteobacteria bacterium]